MLLPDAVRRRRAAWAVFAVVVVMLGAITVDGWLGGRPFDPGDRASRTPTPHALAREASIPLPGRAPRDERGATSRDGVPADGGAGATAGPTPRAADRFADLLVAGIDRRPGRAGGRADTLVLVFLDEVRRRTGLVSVPRDLLVRVPGHGEARVNATLRIARKLGVDGHALLERVVEDTLGVRVGHVVVIDLGGFERLVDASGGVALVVPCPIVDDFDDPRTATGRRRLDLPPGPAVLDGATAAMYVRSRHGRSDFDRARRQQAVLSALGEQLTTPAGTLRLPAVLEAAGELLETSMTRGELLRLARRVNRVKSGPVHGVVLGRGQTVPYRTPDGRSVLRPSHPAIRDALEGLFDVDTGPRPSASTRCPEADIALRPRGKRSGDSVTVPRTSSPEPP